jgi:hypothetical protein
MARVGRLKALSAAMAAIFLCVAAGRLATVPVPLAAPSLTAASVYCEGLRCRLESEPLRLLPAGVSEASLRANGGEAALRALIERPRARALLFLARAVRSLPAAALFLCLGLALLRIGRGDGFSAGGLRWLRRAAAAAMAAVAASPLADTLQASAVSAIASGREQLFLSFDFVSVFLGLLLAGGVWVAVSALDEARRIEAELAAIV